MAFTQVRIATLIGTLLAATGLALAGEPVSNQLSVHHVVIQPGGEERSEPAVTAKPGDVLEYVAEFHNNGASIARGLSATLPLPLGTEFIAASAHPAGARASLDGITFDSMPLKRVVKTPDGSSHEELVPFSEYRYLRWAAVDLGSSDEMTVSARVRLAAGPGS